MIIAGCDVENGDEIDIEYNGSKLPHPIRYKGVGWVSDIIITKENGRVIKFLNLSHSIIMIPEERITSLKHYYPPLLINI